MTKEVTFCFDMYGEYILFEHEGTTYRADVSLPKEVSEPKEKTAKKQQKDQSYWTRRLALAAESLTEENNPYKKEHNDGGELTSFEEGTTKPGALLRIALALEKIAEKQDNK